MFVTCSAWEPSEPSSISQTHDGTPSISMALEEKLGLELPHRSVKFDFSEPFAIKL